MDKLRLSACICEAISLRLNSCTMHSEDAPFKSYDHAAKMARGFAFTIDTDGRWTCHDPDMGEGPIRRQKIAGLFAGAGTGFLAGKGLSRDENGEYWLKAPPNDRYKVEVEDVPFVITDFEQDGNKLTLITNFNERVTFSGFLSRPDGPFPDVPYVEVRAGLLARLGRNVYYQLAELGILT